MKGIFYIFRKLYRFETYKEGLIIHLTLFFFYSAVFIGIYFWIRLIILPPEYKAYYQIKLSQKLVLTMVFHLLSLIYFRWPQFKLLVKEYFSEKGSPYNLAVFRIYFFFSLGGHLLYYCAQKEISWSYLPETSRVSLPFMGWFIHSIPISPEIFYPSAIVAGVLCWMICLGFFTRLASLLLLPFAFYVFGVPMFFGKMSHYHILLWVPVFLSLAPTADVLSIDALIKKKRFLFEPVEHQVKYFLPFKIIWLILAILYMFAGIIKLWDCGLDWALTDSMINQMRWEWVEHYDKVPSFRLDNYPVLAKIGGLGVIYFELLYFLLVIKPPGRIWAFFGGFSLHKMSGYFMYIDFINLRQVALTYLNWEKLFLFVKGKFRKLPAKIHIPDSRSLWQILKSEKLLLPFSIGMLFISVNFVFSSFKIHSYPFSSYPTYSAIVPGEIQIIRMEAISVNNEKIDVKQLGESSNFRWENIRGYEIRIARAFENKDDRLLKEKLNEYWQLWRNNVKGLDQVSRIEMYLETTSIVPERRKEVIKTDTLGVVVPGN